jgi:hypothetical protein
MGRGVTHIQMAAKAQKKADKFSKHLTKCVNTFVKPSRSISNKKYEMTRDKA